MAKEKKKPVVSSKELAAMKSLVKDLEGLTEEECKQVLGWACKRILGNELYPNTRVVERWFPHYVQPFTWFQNGTPTEHFEITCTDNTVQWLGIDGTASNNADNVTLATTQ